MRKVNEDAYDVRLPAAEQAAWGCLYVVADGVGGEAAGEAASRLGVETVISEYYAYPSPDPPAALRHAVEKANAAVHASAASDRRATTMVAAVILGETLHVASVGDSRLYLVRGGEVRQVTRDHSWVQEQVRAGNLDPVVARTHPLGNVITRWLGQPSVEPDLFAMPLEEGDRIVMCSDGLIRHVDESTIGDVVERLAPEPAAARLIALANEGGGSDNITVVVVALGGDLPERRSDTQPLPVVRSERQPEEKGTDRAGRVRSWVGRPLFWLVAFVLAIVAILGVAALAIPRIPIYADVAIPIDQGPTALAVSSDGRLFVGSRDAAGSNNGKIEVYHLGLDDQSAVLPDPYLLLGLRRPSPEASWDTSGTVSAMAVGPDGVYAAEGDRVVAYTSSGTRLRDFPAAPDGRAGQTRGLAVDAAGRIYVADGTRVIRLDPTGQLDTTWAVSPRVDLRAPSAVALSSDGGLYLADADAARVAKLGPSGDLVGSWSGEGGVKLVRPQALAVAADGRVYVADGGLRLVLELTDPGQTGYRQDVLGEQLSLAADRAGDLYVGNVSTGRVTATRPGGWYVRLPSAR